MEFTGERYTPAIAGEIRHEHLHRYAFAIAYVAGKRVLDLACGEGYGSAMLARHAKHVIGVDLAEEAIAHARAAYRAPKHLEFRQGDATRIPLPDASVDVIVSFETIEHHDRHDEMMREFIRVLHPDGQLILSSPNKKVYSDETGYINEFHVKELYFEELDALTHRYFSEVTYLGQRFATGSAIYPLEAPTEPSSGSEMTVWADDGQNIEARLPRWRSPMYFMLMATNAKSRPNPAGSFFASEASDLYLEFKDIARWASGVHDELTAAQAGAKQAAEDMQSQLTGLRESSAATSAERDSLIREAEQLTAAQAVAKEAAEALQSQLAELRESSAATIAQRDALIREVERAASARLTSHLASALTSEREHTAAIAELSSRLWSSEAALRQHQTEWIEKLHKHSADFERQHLAVDLALSQLHERLHIGEHSMREALLANQEREREAGAAVQKLHERVRVTEQQLYERLLQEQQATQRAKDAGVEQASERQAHFEHERQQLLLAVEQLRDGAAQNERDLSRQVTAIAAREVALHAENVLLKRLLDEQAAAMKESTDQREDERVAWQQRLLDEDQRFLAQVELQKKCELELQSRLIEAQDDLASVEREWGQRLAHADQQVAATIASAETRDAQLRAQLEHSHEAAAALGRAVIDASASWPWRMASAFRAVRVRAGWRPSPAAFHELVALAKQSANSPVPDARESSAPPERSLANHIDMKNAEILAFAPTETVDDLLALDDLPCVRAAYWSLLGREPDPEGEAHFVDALSRGGSRLQMLHDMRFSAEGAGRTTALLGFDQAMRRLRRLRMPLIGRLYREASPSPMAALRSINRLAGYVAQADARAEERLASVERSLQPLREFAEQHRQALTDIQQQLQQQVQPLQALVAHVVNLDARLADIEREAQPLRQHVATQAQAGVMASALGRFRWPKETDLWQATHQLLVASGDTFVDQLFLFAFGRLPHGYEREHFNHLLAGGASRASLVDNVVGSTEFTANHPLLTAALPQVDIEFIMVGMGPLPSIPIYGQPVVSVIIPVYGKLDYTLQCLRSIAKFPPRVPFEVIVVDDCSPDDSSEALARVSGVRLVRNESNCGFIKTCNRGAQAAHGEYLHFLNNDTEVRAGWLDELHRTFALFPGTGFVGSKLIYPDGTLQEAGGILWRDGSAWNFGRGQSAHLPVYNYAREVDYCSGASVMVPAKLFEELGGFDEHYLPAYCEDSDLALKIRDRGLRVIYQPMSVVVHHEGITSGTDTTRGTKAYQVANGQKLFERWKHRLATYQANGVEADDAKDRRMKRRVLVVEHCTPTPDQDAGSVSVFNMLLLLREMDFQVTFVAEDNFLYLPDYTVMLQRAGIEVLYAPHTTSVLQHLQEAGARYDLVYLFRPQVVERHIDAIRVHCSKAKVLFYTHDIHHIRMEREAALLASESKAHEAADMKAREFKAIRSVDSTIVVSTTEMLTLQPQLPDQKLQMLPLLLDIPGTKVPFEAREGIVFVGGFQHTPNVDAMLFFVNEVMPLVRTVLTGVRLYIVGSKAPPSVQALAADDVEVVGFVEDLKPMLDRVRVSVAPIRYGAGVKGKVGTALANGLPTVATPIAAEGMSILDGEHLLVAETPAQMVAAIARLYTDKALWEKLRLQGSERAEMCWGPLAAYAALNTIITNLGFSKVEPKFQLCMYTPAVFNTAQ